MYQKSIPNEKLWKCGIRTAGHCGFHTLWRVFGQEIKGEGQLWKLMKGCRRKSTIEGQNVSLFDRNGLFINGGEQIINNLKKQERINGFQTLAELHQDRIDGFRKVIKETDLEDFGLRKMFMSMAAFSEEAKAELDLVIGASGGEVTDSDNSFLSDVHKTWIDIKTAITNNNREALLSSCEFGENVIIGAYDSMLANENFIEVKERLLLHSHLKALKESLKVIQELKELEEVS